MTFRTRNGVVRALENVNLDVEDGEFMVLIGPSGCGKSTLLKLAAGILSPTRGEVVLGNDVALGPRTEDIGMMFQSPVLLPWKSVLANVMLQAQVRRLPTTQYEARSRHLLKQVGLEGYEDRYVFELSGGMQQRTSFCRAILHEPELLLMDEPFGALDALTREQIAFDLQRMWIETGRQTVLFVTHSIDEAILLGDKIGVFSRTPGHIVDVLPVDLERPRNSATLRSADAGALGARLRSLIGMNERGV